MNQEEKAARYDAIVAEADVVQREKSKLQSANAGINTTSLEYDRKLEILNNKLGYLENEMRKLYVN